MPESVGPVIGDNIMPTLKIETADPLEINLIANRNRMFHALKLIVKASNGRGHHKAHEAMEAIATVRSLVNEIKRTTKITRSIPG